MFLVVRRLVGFSSIDLLVYRVEGLAVRTHLDLYSTLPTPQGLQATYPPFAALVFVPLTWLPQGWLPWTGLVVNIALLLLVVRLSLRFAGFPRALASGPAATLVVGAIALWAEPVFLTLRNGQINLALLALVLWDVNRIARSRWTGVGIGIAAGLKVTPAVLIVYLLLTRRYRAAAVAAGTFVATLAVSGVLLPNATWRFWSKLVFDSGRVGDVEAAGNQSIYGAVARITHSRVATPAELCARRGGGDRRAGVLGAGGAAARRQLGRRGLLGHRAPRRPDRLDPSLGVGGAGGAPALATGPSRGWCRSSPIFWTQVVWTVPHGGGANELAFSPGQIAVSCSYTAAGLAFLVAVGVRAARAGAQERIGEPCGKGVDEDAAPASASSSAAGGVHP